MHACTPRWPSVKQQHHACMYVYCKATFSSPLPHSLCLNTSVMSCLCSESRSFSYGGTRIRTSRLKAELWTPTVILIEYVFGLEFTFVVIVHSLPDLRTLAFVSCHGSYMWSSHRCMPTSCSHHPSPLWHGKPSGATWSQAMKSMYESYRKKITFSYIQKQTSHASFILALAGDDIMVASLLMQ
jgi:hypothetical protein